MTDETTEVESVTPSEDQPRPSRRTRRAPQGDAAEPLETIDLASAGDEPPPRKTRGPRAGSSRKKKTDPDLLAKQLVGIHVMAATVTGLAPLQISEAEGKVLASGIMAVCDEYGLSLEGKTGAAVQLFAAAAMIYGPRALVIAKMVRDQKAKQPRTFEADPV